MAKNSAHSRGTKAKKKRMAEMLREAKNPKFGSPAWRKKYAAKAARNRKAAKRKGTRNPKTAAAVLKKIKALLK